MYNSGQISDIVDPDPGVAFVVSDLNASEKVGPKWRRKLLREWNSRPRKSAFGRI
jgi:hypothetical protein